MNEIGSEFWTTDVKVGERQFFLSGRTALEYIIRNIISENKKINSVLLPSWCCHTMIEPFIRHRVAVRFYDVYYQCDNNLRAEIPEPMENEIFYYMTYFGSSVLRGIDDCSIRKKWCCIIADDTHSWLGSKRYEKYSIIPDYTYISYRKWSGIYGIAMAKRFEGKFSVTVEKKSGEVYSSLRKNAGLLKKRYIEGENINKSEFLAMYIKSEGMLEEDYINYAPVNSSVEQLINIDCEKMKEKRCRNAMYLIGELSSIKDIRLLEFDLAGGDVPLFIPILVDESERDNLRKFLIQNSIYCPVHWPVSHYHKGISERAKKIYNEELSLLCDQRYTVDDMKYIVNKIKEFYDGKEK